MTTLAGMQANEKCTSLQEGSKLLLPRIPDEITFAHIVPKLPWEVFYILSSVSRAWRHGIQTRQVYDARVRSHSTETLVVVIVDPSARPSGASLRTRIGLCSMREDGTPSKPDYIQIHPACRGLPPISYLIGQCVCSDGYIYLLAAKKAYSSRLCSDKVFVFDVAGQGQWKECASMNEPRTEFGSGVMHGKLYVFGGLSSQGSNYRLNPSIFCGSAEVYDPKEDCWSRIRPMKISRFQHEVQTVGDELFVHGGFFLYRDQFNSRKTKDDEVSPGAYDLRTAKFELRAAKFLEVYHPVKDEWRVVNPFGRDSKDYLFAAEGRLYSIDWSSIHVYAGGNSWTHLHSFSFPITAPAESLMFQISTAIVVDGEVLVRASWWWTFDARRGNHGDYSVGQFQSKGFGGESEEILWQKADQFQIRNASYPRNSNELVQL